MKQFSANCRAGLTAAAALSIALPTAAQQNTGPVLEEIVVTAQKRTENLTDVPISIVAFTSEDLTKIGVRQMRELAEFVPNMGISAGNDNNTAVTIRGIGAVSRNIGFDQRVGMYVDGVYLGQSPAQNLDIVDLERIEIARGPQGTLYGKNTVAGAINLIANKPSNELEFNLRGEYGNLNSHRVSAIANVPLGDRLAARVSVSDHHRDGYVDNITTGTKHNVRDGTAVRGQVAFQGEGFDVNIAGDYLESDRTSFNGEAYTDWTGSVFPDPVAPRRLEMSNNVNNHDTREIWGVSATVNANLGPEYTFTSITAYRDTVAQSVQDTDHSNLDLLVVVYPDSYEQFSQEFQLFSPEADRLSYVAGLYYYEQEGETARRAVLGSDLGLLLSIFGSPLAPFGAAFEGATAGTSGKVDTTSWAAYVNGTFDISERLTLGFGARYTKEEKELDYNLNASVVDLGFTTVPVAAIFDVAIGPVIDGRTVAPYQDKDTYSDFSPNVSLTYALTNNLNVFAKYSESFKSGGFNADFVTQLQMDAGLEFDTETVQSYELGVKGTALDNRMRFSVIGFHMDFNDYQVTTSIPLNENTSVGVMRNVGELWSRGLEAEVSWKAGNYLTLQGAVGILAAEYESFPGGSSNRHEDGPGTDLGGNKLGVTPLSIALAVQHNYPLNRWNAELVTRFDWTYADDHYTTGDNIKVSTPGGSIPFGYKDDYSLLNGRIGVESANGWSVYLWARNLLDEEYSEGTGSDFFGTLLDSHGDPRTYGVELSYNFF